MANIYEYQEMLCKKEELEQEITTLAQNSDLPALRHDFRIEQKRLAALGEKIKELNATEKRKKQEIQAKTEQAANTEKQIYDGSVTNPREIQALQGKYEELKNQIHKGRKEIKELEKIITKEKNELNQIAKNLKQLQSQFHSSQENLKKAHESLKEKVEICAKELETMTADINKEVLSCFLSRRHSAGGRLYAVVKPGGSCSVCHRTLTKHTLDQLDAGKTVCCDNCNRYLCKED